MVERINATSLMTINDLQLRIYKGENLGRILYPTDRLVPLIN